MSITGRGLRTGLSNQPQFTLLLSVLFHHQCRMEIASPPIPNHLYSRCLLASLASRTYSQRDVVTLFDVLNLLPHLLNEHFQLNGSAGGIGIGGL